MIISLDINFVNDIFKLIFFYREYMILKPEFRVAQTILNATIDVYV